VVAGGELHLGGNWTSKVGVPLSRLRPRHDATNPLNSTPLAVNFDSRVTDYTVRPGGTARPPARCEHGGCALIAICADRM
jgi:hypothetical protein